MRQTAGVDLPRVKGESERIAFRDAQADVSRIGRRGPSKVLWVPITELCIFIPASPDLATHVCLHIPVPGGEGQVSGNLQQHTGHSRQLLSPSAKTHARFDVTPSLLVISCITLEMFYL
jgi:hypothetical protein